MSLVEALITLAVMFLALSAVAVLLQQSSRVVLQSNAQDHFLSAARVGLELLRGDVAAARVIKSPASGTSSQLVIQCVNHQDETLRLTVPPSPTPGFQWDTPNQVEITYSMDTRQNLTRSVMRLDNNATVDYPVAIGLSGFSANRVAPNAVEITVSFDQVTRILPINLIAVQQAR